MNCQHVYNDVHYKYLPLEQLLEHAATGLLDSTSWIRLKQTASNPPSQQSTQSNNSPWSCCDQTTPMMSNIMWNSMTPNTV